MKRLSTNDTVQTVALAIAALALACGGSQTPDETTPDPVLVVDAPAPPLDPLALMPANTVALFTVDFSQLRGSPYYATVRGWLALAPDMTPAREQAVDILVEQAEIAHLAFVPRPSGSSLTLGAIFVRGNFDHGTPERLLMQVANPSAAERMGPVEVEGHSGIGDAEAALIEVEPGAYLIGPFEHIRPSLRSPQRPAALEQVRELMQRAGSPTSAIRGWLVGNEATWRAIDDTGLNAEQAQTVRMLVFGGDASDGITAFGRVEATSVAAAETLVGEVQQQVDALTGSLPARALGLGVLGQATQIQVEGNDAVLRFSLADEDVTVLLQRFDGFVRMAAGAR